MKCTCGAPTFLEFTNCRACINKYAEELNVSEEARIKRETPPKPPSCPICGDTLTLFGDGDPETVHPYCEEHERMYGHEWRHCESDEECTKFCPELGKGFNGGHRCVEHGEDVGGGGEEYLPRTKEEIRPCMGRHKCGCCLCEEPGIYVPSYDQSRCAEHGGFTPKTKEVKV